MKRNSGNLGSGMKVAVMLMVMVTVMVTVMVMVMVMAMVMGCLDLNGFDEQKEEI